MTYGWPSLIVQFSVMLDALLSERSASAIVTSPP